MTNLKYREISIMEESGSCLLCHDAACTKACPYGMEVDKVIRSLRFENYAGAKALLPDALPCISCESKDCVKACVKSKMNRPIAADALMELAAQKAPVTPKEVDLSIDFCGVRCENPFFLSSSVVASNYEMVAKAFDMGWAGAVFKTVGMFVPDEVSPRFDALRKESLPFVGFKNIEQISEYSLEDNLKYLKKLKEDYPTKILVASIMGQDEGEWTELARLMTQAGVDIVECNFSCPHMASNGLGSDVGQDPELVARFTKATKRGTHLPVLAKMTPNIGNMEIPAMAAMKAGADGIAAINTIKSVMNVNLETFASGPEVEGKTSVGGYSGKAVKPIALRFIHAMKDCAELADAPISGMGGIETWRDAAEFMALGCENLQITTAVMQYGYRIIEDIIEGMELYLGEIGADSITEIVGRALPKIISADDLERSSICYPKFVRDKCVGCGRCYLSCFDGGHQAIKWDYVSGKPTLIPAKCVGCHLCVKVCPAQAITQGTRVAKKNKI